MKELTIEEKAKRYDEAIKVAKGNYETIMQMNNDCTFSKEGIVNTFLRMFPELKESEDEKIRKALRERIINYDPNNEILIKEEGISQRQFLAWIEKQGQVRCTSVGKKEATGVLKEMLDDVGMKEQKQEWSEEDKYLCTQIEGVLQECWIKNLVHFGLYKKMRDFLKSLKDRVQPQSQWKPSDEQMNAFDAILVYNPPCSNECRNHLITLYNELKKLREE
jgi:hypothetical protein